MISKEGKQNFCLGNIESKNKNIFNSGKLVEIKKAL